MLLDLDENGFKNGAQSSLFLPSPFLASESFSQGKNEASCTSVTSFRYRDNLVPSKPKAVPALQSPCSKREVRRARRIANRTRTSVACLACRNSRTKCNEFRPCFRCQRTGKADSCDFANDDDDSESEAETPAHADWAENPAPVHSESPANSDSQYTQAPPMPSPVLDLPDLSLHRIARGWWLDGYQPERVASVLRGLPPDLRQALVDGLAAVDSATAALPPPVAAGDELPEEFWADVEYCGYWRTSYDPKTMKRTGMLVNRAFAAMAGIRPEELVARFQQRDLPIHNELDWFCAMADNMLRIRQPTLTRYVRGLERFCAAEPGRDVLLTWTTSKRFDANGRIVEVRHWVTPASEEEYDSVVRVAPQFCRPLAGDMGDYRSAKHALAGAAADRAETMASLAASPAGSRRLATLAKRLAARFAAAAAADSGAALNMKV